MKLVNFNFKKVIALLICLMLSFDIYVCFERSHRLHKSHKFSRHHRVHKSHKRTGEVEIEGDHYTIHTTNPMARLVIGFLEALVGNETKWMQCIKTDWVTKITDVGNDGFVEKQINALSPLLGTVFNYSKKVLGFVCLLLSFGFKKLFEDVWGFLTHLTGHKRKRRVFLEGKLVRRRRRFNIDYLGFIGDITRSLQKIVTGDKTDDLVKYEPVKEATLTTLKSSLDRRHYDVTNKDEAAFNELYISKMNPADLAEYKAATAQMKKIENDLSGNELIDKIADGAKIAVKKTQEFFQGIGDFFTGVERKEEGKEEKSILETITQQMLVFREKIGDFFKSDTMKQIIEKLNCVVSAAFAGRAIVAFVAKIGLIVAAFASGVGIIPYLLLLIKNILCTLLNIEKIINYFVEIVENPNLHVKTYNIGKLLGTMVKILVSADGDDIKEATAAAKAGRKLKRMKKMKKLRKYKK